ncbi:hypothetical protein RKD40_006602 [Streptomyces ambofaciens]
MTSLRAPVLGIASAAAALAAATSAEAPGRARQPSTFTAW